MKFIKNNCLIIIGIIILIVSSILYNSSVFNFFTACSGILYVYLIGKNKSIAYLFGITNNLMYSFSLYENALYLSLGYYLLYSLPLLIYGFIYWRTKNPEVLELPKFIKILLFIFILLSFGGLGFFGYQKWYYDMLTLLFGSFALILMVRKYKEQWIVWSFANLIGALLWTGVTVNTIYDPALFLMWSMYLINSLYFLAQWNQKQ